MAQSNNRFVQCVDRLIHLLLNHEFFNREEFNDLVNTHNDNPRKQLRNIFDAIESRDREDIQLFIDIIDQSDLVTEERNQSRDLFHKCKPMGNRMSVEEYKRNLIRKGYKSDDYQPFVEIFRNTRRMSSATDGQDIPEMSAEKEISDFAGRLEDKILVVEDVVVKMCAEVKHPSEECYRMAAKPRGYCIIINNIEFVKNSYRSGSMADELRLTQVFEQLGFEVKPYRNLCEVEMRVELKKIAKQKTLKKHDALVVIILSHGSKYNTIFGSDDIGVRFEELREYFTAANCPQLIGKPKIFIINACRGDKKDPGYQRPKEWSGKRTELIASFNDFLVLYSTPENYISLRHPSKGSLFGQELVECLSEWAHNTEFVRMIRFKLANAVDRRETKINQTDVKQSIDLNIVGGFKDVYFNPGYYESRNGSHSLAQPSAQEMSSEETEEMISY